MNNITEKSGRLYSLDALRGFDMLFIAGAGAIVKGFAALTGLAFLGDQMEHVAWHGIVAYDMIFPLFLFIAGVSFPFSLAKQRERYSSDGPIYRKIVQRGVLLIALGLIYNGAFTFEHLRVASVLGRIGLAWALAAIIFVATDRLSTRLIWVAGILLSYWALLGFFQAPDINTLVIKDSMREHLSPDLLSATDHYSMRGNMASYLDRMLLPGRIYLGIHDPEGLASTFPSVATALLGMLAGLFIRTKQGLLPGAKITLQLAVCGALFLLVGKLWGMAMPINKNLWASSFVVYVGGWSLLMLSLFYYLVDVRKYRRGAFFFRVVGLNSITIYMAQAVFSFSYTTQFIFGGTIRLFPDNWEELVYGMAYVTVVWLFLYFLYKKDVFLKV